MRKVLGIILFSLCLCCLFLGCDDKKADEPALTETAAVAAEPVVAEPVKGTVTCVSIYPDGTPFYEEHNDGKMYYVVDALLGDTVELITLDGEIEQKKAIRSADGKELQFIRVEYDGQEYWTRDIFITNGSGFVPAVITDDVFTYKTPDIANPSSEKLTLGQIVAAGPVIDSLDELDSTKFIPVVRYSGTSYGSEVYVKASAVTTVPADVVAVQALTRMDGYGEDLDDTVWYEVMEQIGNLNLSSGVRYYLGL